MEPIVDGTDKHGVVHLSHPPPAREASQNRRGTTQILIVALHLISKDAYVEDLDKCISVIASHFCLSSSSPPNTCPPSRAFVVLYACVGKPTSASLKPPKHQQHIANPSPRRMYPIRQPHPSNPPSPIILPPSPYPSPTHRQQHHPTHHQTIYSTSTQARGKKKHTQPK